MSAISPDSIANSIWKHLEPKMNAQALTDPQLEEHKKLMTTKLEELMTTKLEEHTKLMTTKLEEHTKLMTTKLEEKFEEHTKLMDKKFEKQKRLTNASFYLLVALPSISAILILGMNWMMMTKIGEWCYTYSDTNGEDPLKCNDARIIGAALQKLLEHVVHLNQGAMTWLYNQTK